MRSLIPLWILLQHAIALPQGHTHESQTLGKPVENSISPSPPKVNSTNTDSLYPLPSGFLIEPDLDSTKPARTPGAKLIKIRNGPMTVEPHKMLMTGGFLPMPCTDCFVTALQGNLEYENGTSAHIDSGAWLHHMTMSNMGKNDLVCDYFGLSSQRMYSAGNEREVSRINVNGQKYGLQIGPTDQYTMIVELMNQNSHPIVVYVTQTYEIIEGNSTSAEGYKDAKMAWLDITGCGISSVKAVPGKFEAISPVWKSTINGTLLFSTGHTHDGGLDTTLYINNKPVCVNGQLYGRKKEYVERGSGKPHISDIGVCVDFGKIKVGDELKIGAHYDSKTHELEPDMTGKGLEPLMGISRIYIGS